MTTRTKAVAAACVVALIAAAFFVLRDDAPVAPRPATTRSAPSEPRVPVRTRAAPTEIAPADVPAPDAAAVAERAKWPIRVTTNVPGATVTMQIRIVGGDPDPPPETKTTDAKGFVGFAPESGGASVALYRFVARCEGWATESAGIDEPGDVRIELVRGVAVRGRVVDHTGAAVEHALIFGAGDESWISRGDEATDATGGFEKFASTAGAVTFRVWHRGFVDQMVSVEAPATDLVVTLEPGLQISGRVAFPDGRPLPGVSILNEMIFTVATTDADGRFVVSGLAPGPVRLWCKPADAWKTVEAGAVGVDFVVKCSVVRIRYLDR